METDDQKIERVRLAETDLQNILKNGGTRRRFEYVRFEAFGRDLWAQEATLVEYSAMEGYVRELKLHMSTNTLYDNFLNMDKEMFINIRLDTGNGQIILIPELVLVERDVDINGMTVWLRSYRKAGAGPLEYHPFPKPDERKNKIIKLVVNDQKANLEEVYFQWEEAIGTSTFILDFGISIKESEEFAIPAFPIFKVEYPYVKLKFEAIKSVSANYTKTIERRNFYNWRFVAKLREEILTK